MCLGIDATFSSARHKIVVEDLPFGPVLWLPEKRRGFPAEEYAYDGAPSSACFLRAYYDKYIAHANPASKEAAAILPLLCDIALSQQSEEEASLLATLLLGDFLL